MRGVELVVVVLVLCALLVVCGLVVVVLVVVECSWSSAGASVVACSVGTHRSRRWISRASSVPNRFRVKTRTSPNEDSDRVV